VTQQATTPFKPPVHRDKRVRRRAHATKKARDVTAIGRPVGEPEIQAGLGPTAVPPISVASASSSRSSVLPFLLLIVFGLALAVVAIALTPTRVLPRPVGVMVYERRDPMVVAGIAIALGIGVGLLITGAGS
jgi:hypothetical protein